MVKRSKRSDDAFGQFLLAHYCSKQEIAEIIEREDDFIALGSDPSQYLSEYRKWSAAEKQAIKHARGRVLDIGSGAGRHALHLQEKGLEVTAIDTSPGAVKVCKMRGVKKVMSRSIDHASKFRVSSFDTVLMMGNNFGLVGDHIKAPRVLRDLARITSDEGRIIAATLNPYGTRNPDHLRYHKFNKARGRWPGQITIRVRFGSLIGSWFDYLFVSPKEMESLLDGTEWKIEKLVGNTDDRYFAIIGKKPA
jgi:SAM-dependent methyltransferase